MPARHDDEFLARAIALAGNGLGHVSPNPVVGAVIVRDGQVIGEGWHEAFGGRHAEPQAIAAAGGVSLVGATMYVSLEPCCHHGKQPPCTDAILAAGISRVVVAAADPTPKASGRGPAILRGRGVDVVVAEGELADRARAVNQPFLKHARTGRPWVLFKTAMSLDGRIATASGDSQWISGEESRARGHRWRAEVDAVAVGIGTALADNPRLTARIPGVVRQPRRLVFDSAARLPLDSLLVREAPQVPLTVLATPAAPASAIDALRSAGADVVVCTREGGPERVAEALDLLGRAERPITSILLEGGPGLAAAFLGAGEIDELRLFVAPILIGGSGARGPVEGVGVEKVADAVRAGSLSCEPSGDDVLLRAALRRW